MNIMFDTHPINNVYDQFTIDISYPDLSNEYYIAPNLETKGFTRLMKCVLLSNKYPHLLNHIISTDVSTINDVTENGWSALMIASRNSRTISTEKTVELLIESKSNVNIQDKDGWTALMIASKNSNIESTEKTVELLIESKSNVNIQDNDGWTALMIATRYFETVSTKQTVRLLLQGKSDVNIQSKNGWTALMVTSNYSKTDEIVKNLIEYKTDINIQSNTGWTALMLASNEKIVDLLITSKSDVNLKTDDGWTALMLASHMRSDTDSATNIVRLLLEAKSDVNVQTEDGFTVLMLTPNVTRVKMLIHYGANINSQSNIGGYVVEHHNLRQRYDICKLLIENDALFDRTNKFNMNLSIMRIDVLEERLKDKKNWNEYCKYMTDVEKLIETML